MYDEDFYPVPPHRQRSITRWLILALHGITFAGVIFTYPWLVEHYPDVLDTNNARMVILGWAVVITAHTVIISVVDAWKGIVHARKERQRLDEYHSQKKRQHLIRQVTGGGEDTSL